MGTSSKEANEGQVDFVRNINKQHWKDHQSRSVTDGGNVKIEKMQEIRR